MSKYVEKKLADRVSLRENHYLLIFHCVVSKHPMSTMCFLLCFILFFLAVISNDNDDTYNLWGRRRRSNGFCVV